MRVARFGRAATDHVVDALGARFDDTAYATGREVRLRGASLFGPDRDETRWLAATTTGYGRLPPVVVAGHRGPGAWSGTGVGLADPLVGAVSLPGSSSEPRGAMRNAAAG